MRDHAHGGQAWFWEQFGKSFTDIEREVIETIATPTRLITVMNLSGPTPANSWVTLRPAGAFTVRNVQVSAFAMAKRQIAGVRPTSWACCSNSV